MGRTEFPNLKWITSEPWVGCGQFIYESEMALFPECTELCAQKIVDTADIVRDAIFCQLRKFSHCSHPMAYTSDQSLLRSPNAPSRKKVDCGAGGWNCRLARFNPANL